jgi:hypothetical protein
VGDTGFASDERKEYFAALALALALNAKPLFPKPGVLMLKWRQKAY